MNNISKLNSASINKSNITYFVPMARFNLNIGLICVLLFPLAYIFFYVSIKPFGTIDQFIAFIAAYFIVCERILYYNEIRYVGININKTLIITYSLYCCFSLLSILNNPESDISSIYHSITILAKPFIAIVVFFSISSLKDLRLCMWSMILFVLIILFSVVYFSYYYHNPFALRMILSQQEGYTIFTNPNLLTRSVILILPMLFVYSFYIKNYIICFLLRCIVFFCIMLPIITISRATTVSLSIIMFVLFWKNNNKFMILILIIILLIGVNIFVVNNRFVEVLEKGYAVGQRDLTAEISIASIKKNLLLGTGKRTAIENLEKHGGPTVGKDRRTLHEHNMYLYLMVESGLIGLLLFLSLMYFYIKYLIDHIRKAKNGMLKNLLFANLLGFLGFMLTTFTGGSINENIFWYQIGIAFGIIKLITISNYYQKTNFIPSTRPRVIG